MDACLRRAVCTWHYLFATALRERPSSSRSTSCVAMQRASISGRRLPVSLLCVPTLCPQATLSRREAAGQQPALNLSPVLKNRRPPAPAGLLHRSQLARSPEQCCGAVRVGLFHSMCSKLIRSLAVVAHLRAAQPGEKFCYGFASHAPVSEPPRSSVCTYAGPQRSSCRCSSMLRSAYVFASKIT